MYSFLCSKKFTFLFISLFTIQISFAQTGTIKGSVQTADGKPAEFVNITLQGTTKGTTVNKNGHYSITNITPGSYTLIASFTGLVTQTRQINITAANAVTQDFTLTESNEKLQEVVVSSGKVNKFTRTQSNNVAKIPLNNLENPQAYTAISRELIDEQQIVTYSDVLKNVPGVSLQLPGNTNAPGGTVTARGFSSAALLRNGAPGITVGIIDPVNIETLEALKGPSGTLFGSSLVSFGGAFNRVTKKPFDTFQGSASYTGGSFGLSRITADINAPLNEDKTLLFRVTGARHNETSFQDAGFQAYTFVAPSLTYKASDKLTFNLDGEFMQGRFNNFYRLFPDASNATGAHTPAELNIDWNRHFTGDDIYTNITIGNFYAQADYQISDHWKSQTNFSYANSSGDGMAGYMSMLAGNQQLMVITQSQDYSKNAMSDIQQNFTGDFKIGNLRNRLVFGLDYYHNEARSSAGSLVGPTLNAANPGAAYGNLTHDALIAGYADVKMTRTISGQNTYSAYLQDVVNITDQLIALAGVRVDRFENQGTTNTVTATTAGKYDQTAFAPKFGLVYQIIRDKVSLFGNYMNGFQNVAPVTQPDGSVNSFKPQQAYQLEGGVKLNLFEGKLSSTMSYYDIQVKNTVRTDPDRPGYSIQNGMQKSKGFEADVNYNPVAGLNLIAGYAYNYSKYLRSSASVDGLRPPSAGPQDMVNGWLSYRLTRGNLKGLGFGFGGNYAGKNYVALTTTSSFVLPAYTTLNASVFYDQPRYRIGLKCNDINNEHYYIGWSTVIPQAPRTVLAEFTLKFGGIKQ